MGVELAVGNAASHWTAMAGARGWERLDGLGFTAFRADAVHRVLLEARPVPDPGAVRAELAALFRAWESPRVCVEDPTQALDLADLGFEPALSMPVMVRPAGPVTARAGVRPLADPELVRAGEACSEADLAEAERVVVEGFPIGQRLPWRRGGQFPRSYEGLPGRRSWLARVDGHAAAACVTYDDGVTVGFYWVATLPEFRSRGAARAVMLAALDAHPDRAATLTATLLGEPLYRRLGFTERALARWWQSPASSPRPPR
ncbi:GNAT superfamily N-acetyltransferase [Streptacidiphilus sp. MAP12-33]|uniref:GNAT family N-acetyltransferase n=1 Tax=Streptacidiphilus sp. MAP12-33 TaxID=3156266 RepID=UPI0035175A2D